MAVFPDLHSIFEWQPGQHVSLVGDTGSGKTTVAQAIFESREFVLVLRSKADSVKWPGYVVVRRRIREAMRTLRYNRITLTPSYEEQRAEFSAALDEAFKQGGWTVFIDDLFYVQGLGKPIYARTGGLIDKLLTLGRDPGVNSIVTGTQLPVDATKYAIGESRIVISFMLARHYAKVVGEKTSDEMAEVVEHLTEHDIAIFDRRSRAIWRGRLDLRSGQFIGDYVVEARVTA